MYSNGKRNCPVNLLRLYLSHLHPDLDALWQKPRHKIDLNNEVWYCRTPIGTNTLSQMMSRISDALNLSRRYTNHSIRSSAITCLSNAGVATRHIMNLTGHKNPNSIKSYNRDSSEAQKRAYSKCLQNQLYEDVPHTSNDNDESTEYQTPPEYYKYKGKGKGKNQTNRNLCFTASACTTCFQYCCTTTTTTSTNIGFNSV